MILMIVWTVLVALISWLIIRETKRNERRRAQATINHAIMKAEYWRKKYAGGLSRR